MTLTIRIKRLFPEQDADIPLPRYMTDQAAGMDLCASVTQPVSIAPGAVALIPTGLAMALPEGHEAQIRPRSGLAIKHGVGVINAPGTIDADYRGEIKVGLINFSDRPYIVERGDRIAQMIIGRVYQARLETVEHLEDTPRSDGGFGHTGA